MVPAVPAEERALTSTRELLKKLVKVIAPPLGLVFAVLGVPPGSVTPFGLVNAAPGQVRFVMDRHLAEGFGRIWVHPLTNAASTGIAPADLLSFLEGCGHPAMLLDLG